MDLKDKRASLEKPLRIFHEQTFGRYKKWKENKAWVTQMNDKAIRLQLEDLKLSVKLKRLELRRMREQERLKKFMHKNKKDFSS